LENLKMPPSDIAVIVLAGIALFAAFANGARGDGFSSLTVPVALVLYANRVLNPAVVVIEVFINLYVLLINLNGVRALWKREKPNLTRGRSLPRPTSIGMAGRHQSEQVADFSPESLAEIGVEWVSFGPC
jgi:uncharacterized membrane protein YfcA